MTLPGIEPRPITDLASRDTRPGVHCKVPRVEGPCFPQCPYPRQREKKDPIRAALQGSNASSTLPVPHPLGQCQPQTRLNYDPNYTLSQPLLAFQI